MNLLLVLQERIFYKNVGDGLENSAKWIQFIQEYKKKVLLLIYLLPLFLINAPTAIATQTIYSLFQHLQPVHNYHHSKKYIKY